MTQPSRRLAAPKPPHVVCRLPVPTVCEMLQLYETLARWLHPYLWLLWLTAAGAALAFGALLLQPARASDEGWLFLPAVVALWALSLVCLAQFFVRPLRAVSADAGLMARLGYGLRRVFRVAVALAISGLLIVTVFLSIRAVRLLLD